MESGEDRSHERGRTTDCIVSSTNTSTWTFTQEDPLGLAGGLNLYGFAQGDPVNFADPFGLRPDDIYYDTYGTETKRVEASGPDRYFVVVGDDTYRLDYALVAGDTEYELHLNVSDTHETAVSLATAAPQYGKNWLAVARHSMPGGTLDFKERLEDRSLWNVGAGMLSHQQGPANMAWGNYMARQGFTLKQALTGAWVQGSLMAGGENPFDQRMIARGYSLKQQ